MRRRIITPLLVAITALATVSPSAAGPHTPRPGATQRGTAIPAVQLDLVTNALSQPTAVVSRPGSADLYVAEKCGAIKVFRAGAVRRVGSIADRVVCDGERGLLSLAFSPTFPTDHRLYVYFSRKDTGDIQVAWVRIEKRKLVSGSFHKVLRISHRQASNHNGGTLLFDPAGLLYISVGDGGGGGNQFGHAQKHTSLLGKILRIDVSHRAPYSIPAGNPLVGTRGRGEIWAIGLRNPWRMSLDRETHSLWIGDVGQDAVEEVDRVRYGNGGLRNLGWSRYEGRSVYDANAVLRGGRLVMPTHTYAHPKGEGIIGGGVYRGTVSTSLQGYYVYGDVNGWIAGFDITDHTRSFAIVFAKTLFNISEAGGELYATYADGSLYHLTAPAA